MYTDLGEPRYISLTTRRRDGSLASAPVWVVSDDGQRLLVWTGAATWKARRIRRDPRVLVAACNARGRERGPRLEGTARILDADARDLVVPLLRHKYGWQRRLLELTSGLRRGRRPAQAYIEITEPMTAVARFERTVRDRELSSPLNRQGGLMYEIFTYGRFEVEPENEDAFIEAWSEFATWISRRPGNRSVRLMRDIRNTGRLVSVGKWDDAEAVRTFKSAPDFKEQLGRIVKLAKDFEPTELVTLVKAADGTSERLSPPAGLEPIHAPT